MYKSDRIDRRGFLKKIGIVSILLSLETRSLLFGRLSLDEATRERNLDIIYNELPKFLHIAETTSEINGGPDQYRQEGLGIVLDGKYLTMAHIINSVYDIIPDKKLSGESYSSNNDQNLDQMVLSQSTTLHGRKLKSLSVRDIDDVAVFGLPDTLKLPDFPAKPSNDLRVGDEVYFIGNPGLKGIKVRQGEIVALNQDSFKINLLDAEIEPGDSGGPVVNSYVELLGLCFGPEKIIKIEKFLET